MSDIYIKRKNRVLIQSDFALPKMLFLAIAVIGAMLIWILKSIGTPSLITIAVPVCLMLLYCGLAWKHRTFAVREDQIGDNCYYLGFLFTLSSLAYALWRFQMDIGGNPADIIGSFGVALWSTIVGIALRVFFAQMRQDPNSIEKESRIKISQAASLLAGDLHQATVTFNEYTRGLQQSVDEVFHKASEIAASTHSSLEQLNERINTVSSPDALLNKKIDGIFSDIEATTSKLNQLANGQLKSVENLITSSDKLNTNVDYMSLNLMALNKSTSAISDGSQGLHNLDGIITKLQNNLEKLSDSFADLHSKNAQAVAGVAKHAQELEQQLSKSRAYTEQTHESLAFMTKTLADKLQ